MLVYFTSKNSGPSWADEKKTLLYVGISLTDAQEAVGEGFRKYKQDLSEVRKYRFPYLFSAVPEKMKFKFVEFYHADGWWYSIVSIDIQETDIKET